MCNNSSRSVYLLLVVVHFILTTVFTQGLSKWNLKTFVSGIF